MMVGRIALTLSVLSFSLFFHFLILPGFTAWSSVREPSQVFTLLETLYRAFDQIAKRRRVFKVETKKKSTFIVLYAPISTHPN